MAEALVFGLIELTSLALQPLDEEVRLVKGVDEDVQHLKTNLEAIHVVIEDAERRQFADQSVRRWLDRLKDVSFDIDNVLDEWNTAILKLKIDRTRINDKVCLSIPSPYTYFKSKFDRITMCHDIAHKIKGLNKKLDTIAGEKDRFQLRTTTLEQSMERPRTTSFVVETDIFGRDSDKEKLVSRLLAEDSCTHEGQNFNIIPIIGMGGMGKTTLAQLVYNDENVKAHFDLRVWVCVSEPFEVVKIAKAIVESIEGSAPNINELENVLQHMRKCIEGKRYFLVLDDVWTDDRQKWEQLRNPLNSGGVGSRVLVTSRKKEVVVIMEAKKHMITLEELSEDDCWSIFKKLAFCEKKQDEYRVLEEIGQKIARKAKGSPLVAKILGSLMCFKKNKAQWKDVLSSELWQSKDFENIFTPFFLSYNDLSAKEKRCFSYCSIFPKDHEFSRDDLVEMWMSQGFVGCGINSKREGHDCFDTLVMRSFFQDFMYSDLDDGVITHCKMHDIVHDFAQFLMSDECVTLVVDDNIEDKLRQLDEKVRHLNLEVELGVELPFMKYKRINQKNLRSLLVFRNKIEIHVDTSLFSDLVSLRTLDLGKCWIEKLPKTIGNLSHLRYLNLMGNVTLEELPDTLCDLCNLQTLNLSLCLSLSRLPKRMDKLLNLKHLYLSKCFNLEGFPKGMGKLTCLQTLDMLIIPNEENKNKGEYFNIEDLENLVNLRFSSEFFINGCGNIKNVEDAKKIDLNDQISYLGLDFGMIEDQKNRFEDDIRILEALEPHPNLKSLSIEYFVGASLSPEPKWLMSLVNLKKIELNNCVNCEMLPCFGKLPVLHTLEVNRMHSVKKLGLEFHGIEEKKDQEDGDTQMEGLFSTSPMILFPKLEVIWFLQMEQLEKWEWSNRSTIRIMPCLKHLKIGGCPHLQELPQFLQTITTLKFLSIYSSKILEEDCKRTSKEWGKICNIPNIEINFESVRKDGIWMGHYKDNERNINGIGTSSSTN